MPPTMPRRGFDVRRAIFSPPGTLTSTTTPTSSVSKTSATAAAICARGPALMAGPPTSRPSPGFVTVPTPGPPRSSRPGASRSVTRAVRWAPWVTSGSSPASLTTTAIAPSPSGSQRSTANDGRWSERGSGTSTSAGASPSRSSRQAALAAAVAHVPVVQPRRSLLLATRRALAGRLGSRSSGGSMPRLLRAVAVRAAERAVAVAVAGVVDVRAARGRVVVERGAEDDERLRGDLRAADGLRELAQRAAQDDLVGPRRAVDDGARRRAARSRPRSARPAARAGGGPRGRAPSSCRGARARRAARWAASRSASRGA